MNFYDFNQIKERANCLTIARDFLGLQVSAEGRTTATWRGGTNPESVSINNNGWHDFATEESGSVIDLVAKVKCNGNMMLAQELLGSYLALSPTMKTAPEGSPRYDKLMDEGYKEVKKYNYTDADGNIICQVVRFEHPEKKKEFLQRTPKGWGLRDAIPPLYNLPKIKKSDWIILVEGEKDADNLIALDLPATTVCGGAKKWREEYAQELVGKDIVILPDNDEIGMAHARLVAQKVIDTAKTVRIVKTSDKPKGDVSDYLANKSFNDLVKLIADSPAITADDVKDAHEKWSVEDAKTANKTPFRNFTFSVEHLPNGKTKTIKTPRQINDLIEDVNRRFIGFPRKVGEKLFDHDRNSKRIVNIDKQSAFFAWIQRKSGQTVEWSREEGCVTKEEFFEGILANARRYEAISKVPDWPIRDDVYYTYGELPQLNPEYNYFEKLIDFFSPANDLYRILLKAMFTAPLYYVRSIPRPLWIIDSIDGAGSGKTKLVEAVAELYGSTPISTTDSEIKKNYMELIKRIVSSSGRQARLVLLDNVTGKFTSPELADLVTKTDISGRPAYGSGEETRPNNLVYAITANSANIDNDLSSRAIMIYVKKPDYSVNWQRELFDYIHKHYLNIFVDIINILENHVPFDLPPVTRCPEFESMIIQAHCKDTDEYSDVIKLITSDKAETNADEELAKQAEEIIRYNLIEVSCDPRIHPDNDKVFIRSDVLEQWFKKESVFAEERHVVQIIRNLANVGLFKTVDKKTKRYPSNGSHRRSGILWNPLNVRLKEEETGMVKPIVVGKIGNGKIGVVTEI